MKAELPNLRVIRHDILKDPLEALSQIAKLSEPSLVVLKDFHPFLAQPEVVRALRELRHPRNLP